MAREQGQALIHNWLATQPITAAVNRLLAFKYALSY